jgi:hypothetical protein
MDLITVTITIATAIAFIIVGTALFITLKSLCPFLYCPTTHDRHLTSKGVLIWIRNIVF